MAKRGRPTKYSAATADEICDTIASGNSLRAVCRKMGIAKSTVFKWLHDHPDFLDHYTRAREIRGEFYGERVSEIGIKGEGGEIDPQVARVAIDAYKWTAARMAPKSWGDKQQIDMDVRHATYDITIPGVTDTNE